MTIRIDFDTNCLMFGIGLFRWPHPRVVLYLGVWDIEFARTEK